jgi:hypothetical protein
MNKDTNKKEEHETLRKNLWVQICVAYTASSNSTSKEGGPNWANKALEEFDKVFKREEENL